MPIVLVMMFLALVGCGKVKGELTQTVSAPSSAHSATPAPAHLTDNDIKICLKDEREIEFSKQAEKNYVRLEGEIPSQDTEYIDCDGRVIGKAHDPIHSYQDIVDVRVRKVGDATIQFIEVENLRTCSVERADVGPDDELFAGLQVKNKRAVFIGTHFTQAGASGRVRVAVTDLPYKLFGQTNLAQGFNLLKVRYYGECKKYDEARKKAGNAKSCLEAPLISEIEVSVDLSITRPDLPGTRQVSVCAHH